MRRYLNTEGWVIEDSLDELAGHPGHRLGGKYLQRMSECKQARISVVTKFDGHLFS